MRKTLFTLALSALALPVLAQQGPGPEGFPPPPPHDMSGSRPMMMMDGKGPHGMMGDMSGTRPKGMPGMAGPSMGMRRPPMMDASGSNPMPPHGMPGKGMPGEGMGPRNGEGFPPPPAGGEGSAQ